jgi:hypothetical protein
VRIVAGPFAGLGGEVVGGAESPGRLRARLDAPGGPTVVEVDAGDAAAAGGAVGESG